MISDPNPIGGGPSPEFLKGMKAMMPSLIKAHKKGNVGKGKSVPVQKRPRKTCPICCALHDFSTFTLAIDPSDAMSLALINDPCPGCQAKLDDGYAAFIGGDKYAFLKHPDLADLAGQICPVSPSVLEQVEVRFKIINEGPPKVE